MNYPYQVKEIVGFWPEADLTTGCLVSKSGHFVRVRIPANFDPFLPLLRFVDSLD